MSEVASKAAIAGLVRALAHGADADDIEPALSILSASLNVETLIDSRIERLIELEQQLSNYPAGARAQAIQKRLGLSKSAYYRLRADVLEAGLLQSHSSPMRVPNSGTRNC